MKSLTKTLINEISLELGIAPAFIEKDFYVVELLKIIKSFESENVFIQFSGGTSLSKGFNLIKRFSEDIDFMIQVPDDWNRTNCGNFRDSIISKINENPFFSVDSEGQEFRDNNKFISFYVNYPKLFKDINLRQQVKIDYSIKPIKLEPQNVNIKSWVIEFLNEQDFVNMNCVAPLETAVNKFSALLWKIDCKDRTKPLYDKVYNEPTIVRHFYDLHSMGKLISENKQKFVNLVKRTYEDDKKRGNKEREEILLPDFCKRVLKKLFSDKKYKEEYENYVISMVYDKKNVPSFEVVINYFNSLCEMIRCI